MWVLILGDLFLFALFFLTFCYYRGHEMPEFAASQARLDVRLGLANTLILLTSSLMVVLAVRRARAGRTGAAALFGGAILCGLGFVAIKAVEYQEKLAAGLTFATNDFFMLYFAFTGIHLLHVIVGLCILVFLRRVALRPDAAHKMVAIESGASFWHLVDLLWIVLFALFYLIG